MALKDDVIGAINAENAWVFAGGVVVSLVVGVAVKYAAPYIRSWVDAFRSFAASCIEFAKYCWNELYIDDLKPSMIPNGRDVDPNVEDDTPLFVKNGKKLLEAYSEAKKIAQKRIEKQNTTLTEPLALTGNVALALVTEPVKPSSPKDCPSIFTGSDRKQKVQAIEGMTGWRIKIIKEKPLPTSSSNPLIFTKEPVAPRGVPYSSSAGAISSLQSSFLATK